MKISIKDLIERASIATDMPVQDFLTDSRFPFHTRPRFAVCFAAKWLKHPDRAIANYLSKNHQTIAHAWRRGAELSLTEPRFAAFVHDLITEKPLERGSYSDIRNMV